MSLNHTQGVSGSWKVWKLANIFGRSPCLIKWLSAVNHWRPYEGEQKDSLPYFDCCYEHVPFPPTIKRSRSKSSESDHKMYMPRTLWAVRRMNVTQLVMRRRASTLSLNVRNSWFQTTEPFSIIGILNGRNSDQANAELLIALTKR